MIKVLDKTIKPTSLAALLSPDATALPTIYPNRSTTLSNPYFPYPLDTTHFLNTIFQIPRPLSHNTILVIIDVTSLNTHIPNNEGIEAAIDVRSTPLHTYHIHPYNTFVPFLLSSSNTTSYSTINSDFKYKAPPWVHAWLLYTQTFTWLPSKHVCYTIPLTTSNPSHGYASLTTFSCCGPMVLKPPATSFNISLHSTSQSTSPTNNHTVL